MLDRLETFILETLSAIFDEFGWGGVVGLMIVENATGISPSEVVLAFAGWMLISAHELPPSFIWLGGLYAAVGSTLGASLTYWAARLGGRPLIDRGARWFRIRPSLIEKAEAQFQRWGSGMVLFGRMVPGVRTLVSIPAGLARMPYAVFCAATFAGTYFWCTLMIAAGYLLGHEWPLISGYVKQALPYVFAAGLILLAAFAAYRLPRTIKSST